MDTNVLSQSVIVNNCNQRLWIRIAAFYKQSTQPPGCFQLEAAGGYKLFTSCQFKFPINSSIPAQHTEELEKAWRIRSLSYCQLKFAFNDAPKQVANASYFRKTNISPLQCRRMVPYLRSCLEKELRVSTEIWYR